MSEQVYLNGEIIPRKQSRIDIYDHGFLYGDGIFEGIRVYNRRIFKLDDHVARLYRSARALNFRICIEPKEFRAAVIDTVRANELESGYIRVTVTRGVGLGLDPSHIDCTSTIVVSTRGTTKSSPGLFRLYPDEAYEKGLEVITASTRVPPAVCIDPQVKSTGKYINSISAKMEANRVGAGEALMLNMEGNVAEATGDNLFLVVKGDLITPPTSQGALPGITRATVIENARLAGLTVREEVVTLFDCYNADEAFLTGTAAEVIPMVRLDSREIGDGKPGPTTNRLIDSFRESTRTCGPEV
jgi:branched-chain amino acid aminotransferase